MAYGLQIFDASGRTLLEVTDRLPRVWSTHTVSGTNLVGPGSGPSGFVSVPGMVRDGTWLAVPGVVTVTGSYFLGGINCYCVTGGFNWNAAYCDSDGFSCSITVFKL